MSGYGLQTGYIFLHETYRTHMNPFGVHIGAPLLRAQLQRHHLPLTGANS